MTAKFLLNAEVHLNDAWSNLAAEADAACSMEVPQRWNDRSQSQVRVQEGTVMELGRGFGSTRRVCGGALLGLDRFQLLGAQRVDERPAAAGLAVRSVTMTARMGRPGWPR